MAEYGHDSDMKIAILAAFPHELRYIIRGLCTRRSVAGNSFPVFPGEFQTHDILAVQTGMGMRNAESALECVIGEFNPGLVLSVGFGGAIYPGARLGDLVWATSVSLLSGETLQTVDIPGARRLAGRLSDKIEVRMGQVVTLDDWMKKSDVRRIFQDRLQHAICDLETYPLARLSLERRLPFIAVRAVTDTEDEEIPEQLLDTANKSGQYSLSRALRIVFSHPGLIPDAFKLWRASGMASRNLYSLVKSLIGLPDLG